MDSPRQLKLVDISAVAMAGKTDNLLIEPPFAIHVGTSPDCPRHVVSEFEVSDTKSIIVALPPAMALVYALQLVKTAQELLAGTVRVSSSEETQGTSLMVERSRPERTDS